MYQNWNIFLKYVIYSMFRLILHLFVGESLSIFNFLGKNFPGWYDGLVQRRRNGILQKPHS